MNYDEEVYEIFWKEIITNKDGTMNMGQLKAELLDFYNMINEKNGDLKNIKERSEITSSSCIKFKYMVF